MPTREPRGGGGGSGAHKWRCSPLSPLLLLTYQLAAFVPRRPRAARADGEQPKAEGSSERGRPGGTASRTPVPAVEEAEGARAFVDEDEMNWRKVYSKVSRDKMSQGCEGWTAGLWSCSLGPNTSHLSLQNSTVSYFMSVQPQQGRRGRFFPQDRVIFRLRRPPL